MIEEPPTSEGVSAEQSCAALRVAMIDSDSGFLVVLSKRLERLNWQ